jgi:Nuf2 family
MREVSQIVTRLASWIVKPRIAFMAASFSYPNVELQEIALVVHSWGYPIAEDDLRPPKGLKPEVVQMVYACAIQKLTGLTIAELDQSAERSLAVIEEWQVNLSMTVKKVNSLIIKCRRNSSLQVQDYMYFCITRTDEPICG